MSKLNWSRSRFLGKPSLDFRWESDGLSRDAAARWLKRAETQRGQPDAYRRRAGDAPLKSNNNFSRESRSLRNTSMSTDWIVTALSSEVPW